MITGFAADLVSGATVVSGIGAIWQIYHTLYKSDTKPAKRATHPKPHSYTRRDLAILSVVVFMVLAVVTYALRVPPLLVAQLPPRAPPQNETQPVTPAAIVPKLAPIEHPAPPIAPVHKDDAPPPTPTPPSPVPGDSELAHWEAIPLDSDAARQIPVYVSIDYYSDDSNTVAGLITEKLDASGFHRVTDESQAALIIAVKDTTQTNDLTATDVQSSEFRPFRWSTSIHVVVHFVRGRTLIDRTITGVTHGGADSNARIASMNQAVATVCQTIFAQCGNR